MIGNGGNSWMFLYSIVLLATCCVNTISSTPKDSKIITEPYPGQEFVLVQSQTFKVLDPRSKKGYQPLEKQRSDSGTVLTSQAEPLVVEFHDKKKKIVKRNTPHPLAIKIDPADLIKKYRDVLLEEKKTESPVPKVDSQKKNGVRPKIQRPQLKTTTPKNIQTTGQPSTPRSFDIITPKSRRPNVHKRSDALTETGTNTDRKLNASGSEPKSSRIEIRTSPFGAEYEYEYIYYYDDDDDEVEKNENVIGKTEVKETKETKVVNGHDGPGVDHSKQASGISERKYASVERTSVSDVSESLKKTRGRTSEQQNEVVVSEERLPQNTRFPPRGKSLSTTEPLETVEVTTKSKPKIRIPSTTTTTEKIDGTTGEASSTTGQHGFKSNSRSRHQPSLDLVDNISFRTYNSEAGAQSTAEETKEVIKEAKEEAKDLGIKQINKHVDNSLVEESVGTTESGQTTTYLGDENTVAMNKVALDLYAILQGTQNVNSNQNEVLSKDEESTSNAELADNGTTVPITTTTTTTTTTEATTTTTEAVKLPGFGRGRYRGRGNAALPKTQKHEPTVKHETNNQEVVEKESPRARKPINFGGRRNLAKAHHPVASSTEKVIDSEANSNKESVAVAKAKPSLANSRKFGGRQRITTTTTQAPQNDNPTTSRSNAIHRPRPTFNIRRRNGLPNASSTEASFQDATKTEETRVEVKEDSSDASSTTAAPHKNLRGRIPSPNIKPLRPGPRINIVPRGRQPFGQQTSTSTVSATSVEEEEEEDDRTTSQLGEEPTSSTQSTPSTSQTTESPLSRLKHRSRLQIHATPKPKITPVPINRRSNPLLHRRKPIVPGAAPLEAAELTEVTHEAELDDTSGSASEEIPKVTTPVAPSSAEPDVARSPIRRRLPHRRLINQ